MIQYPLSQKQDIGNILPPIISRTFGGVNTYDSLMIDDSYFTDSSNVCSDDFPALSTRPGFSVLGQFGSKILGMASWKDEIHVIGSDGGWHRYNGTWTTLLTGLSTTAEWSFTVFQGNLDDIHLIGVNGLVAKKYNGTAVTDLVGVPAGAKYITTYSNRLWVAVGFEVHACALDQPEVWTDFSGTEEDSFAKTMESTRGEDINMLSGSLTKLTIGMKNSIHEMLGDLPSSFTFRLITDDVGTVSNKSVTTQYGIMRLMDYKSIYDYTGGSLPDQEFSQIIGKRIENIDANAVAGSDGNKLYFRTKTNEIAVFDTRTGVNTWNIWKDIDPSYFLFLNNKLYIGDNSGRVLRMEGTSDNGTPISWSAITKPFTNASISQRMRWYKMFVSVYLPPGSVFNVSFSKSISGEDWELISTTTGVSGMGNYRIIVPVQKYALENYVRIKFHGTGPMTMHEYTRIQRALPLY